MDINGDGWLDVISGSYAEKNTPGPMIGVVEVFYGQAGGGLGACTVLKGSDGERLAVTSPDAQDRFCTSTYAVDWDGDGQLDLVLGTMSGSLYLFKGDGAGSFDPRSELLKTVDGLPLVTGQYRSDPVVVDWDGDGDLDLLSGSAMGGVFWSQNTAGPGELPAMQAFEVLVEPEGRRGAGAYGQRLDSMSRIAVADVNGDGKLDILAGDTTKVVTPAAGVTEEEMWARESAWQAEYRELLERYEALTPGERSRREDLPAKPVFDALDRLSQERPRFLHERHTGYVWVFLRE